MDSNIYNEVIINKSVIITPDMINKNLNENIYNNLIKKYENKCLDDGFVLKDSIKIIKKSIGFIIQNKFNGNIIYHLLFSCKICNPQKNMIIDCKIKNINKLGLLAINGPLVIIIPNELNNNKNKFNNLKINDTIKIVVLEKKFKINDTNISVVGKIYNKNEYEKSNKINISKNVVNDFPENFKKKNISKLDLSDTMNDIDSIADEEEATDELVDDDYYDGDNAEIDEENTQNYINKKNNDVVKNIEIYSDDDEDETNNLLNDLDDDQNSKKIILSGGYDSEDELNIKKSAKNESDSDDGGEEYNYSSDSEGFCENSEDNEYD